MSNDELVHLAKMGAFIQDIPLSKLMNPGPMVVSSKGLFRRESDDETMKKGFKTLTEEVRNLKKSVEQIQVDFNITEGGIYGAYERAAGTRNYRQNLIG